MKINFRSDLVQIVIALKIGPDHGLPKGKFIFTQNGQNITSLVFPVLIIEHLLPCFKQKIL